MVPHPPPLGSPWQEEVGTQTRPGDDREDPGATPACPSRPPQRAAPCEWKAVNMQGVPDGLSQDRVTPRDSGGAGHEKEPRGSQRRGPWRWARGRPCSLPRRFRCAGRRDQQVSETTGERDASVRAEAESRADASTRAVTSAGVRGGLQTPLRPEEMQRSRRSDETGGDCSEIPRLTAASLGGRCHPAEEALGRLRSASPTASWRQGWAGRHAAHRGASRYAHLFPGGRRAASPAELECALWVGTPVAASGATFTDCARPARHTPAGDSKPSATSKPFFRR